MRLNDHDFACLLDEIAYAASNQLPIPETLERIGQARLGRDGRVAKAVASHLRSGRSLADAVPRIKSPSASLVRHAFTSPTGGIRTDTVNVSDDRNGVRIGDLNANLLCRLSMRIRDRASVVRMKRLMWFYPLVLVTIAYCILLFATVPLINKNEFKSVAVSFSKSGPLSGQAYESSRRLMMGQDPLEAAARSNTHYNFRPPW